MADETICGPTSPPLRASPQETPASGSARRGSTIRMTVQHLVAEEGASPTEPVVGYAVPATVPTAGTVKGKALGPVGAGEIPPTRVPRTIQAMEKKHPTFHRAVNFMRRWNNGTL